MGECKVYSWFVFFFWRGAAGALAQAQVTERRKAEALEVSVGNTGSDTGEKMQQPQAGSRGFPGPREAGQGQHEAVGGVRAPEGCSVECMDGSAWASGMAGKRLIFFFFNCTTVKYTKHKFLPS